MSDKSSRLGGDTKGDKMYGAMRRKMTDMRIRCTVIV